MAETYSINQVAELFNTTISKIRYYDKRGLLPFVVKNASGHREFTRADLGFMKTIMCLKDTDMRIADIRAYIDLCMRGGQTVAARQALLEHHKQTVQATITTLQANLSEIDAKIDRYQRQNAGAIVDDLLAQAAHEKTAQHLHNPFVTPQPVSDGTINSHPE